MNTQDAIDILDNAILGNPSTCLSDHARKLAQVRNFLASSPPVVADAPRATTPPGLKTSPYPATSKSQDALSQPTTVSFLSTRQMDRNDLIQYIRELEEYIKCTTSS